ncbi:MAG: 16S rRNA (guanine(527)-N(7))-methyltransferase RsmG [Clostridia bacterium]|nr:16S rRNA (guanine(527)-N(7))-methyltransferase RsmG [Clostridia bacterium]
MERLERAFKHLNVNVSRETLDKFETYMNRVLEWNEKVNLTAITDREEFVVKHFVDSVLCVNIEKYKGAKTVIDVGTGAGFPGIPLALISPEKEFLLMDSLNKRIKILEEIKTELGLNNVSLLHGRAEEVAKNKLYREKFDVCVSRAVARVSVLSEYCLPFIKVGGALLAYKGTDYEREMKEGERAVKILGGKYGETCSASIPDFDFEHRIVCIEKIKSTPAAYPRKAGTPAKEPL